ncbi:MAG: hypothetical protein H6662_16495 [Ardenticatenaceae bacterium]|nr:hypothetical protein [Anaerolineales bacterium]MCB8923188.1 hypothetical protein [Ardenticatenaceae bacterium]MCB9004867.1 hypothetical protein [Ardenticatenaceae bacterium]
MSQSPIQAPPHVSVPSAQARSKPELEVSLFFVIVLSGIYIAYEVMAEPSGGHPVGHILGILGTLLMLMTEVLYSLRKRTRLLNWAGPVRNWLSFHIITGIVGPFMVLMHTGLQYRGIAGISFLLTLIVVGSGFVGRYLYTALPRTLTGVVASRQDIEREATYIHRELTQFQSEKSARVQQLVAELSQRHAEKRSDVLTVFGRAYYQWRYQRQLSRALRQMDQLEQEQRQQLHTLLSRQRELARQVDMLESARRLLRFWHIFHVPFGLTLFFSAAVHVVATIYFRAGLLAP